MSMIGLSRSAQSGWRALVAATMLAISAAALAQEATPPAAGTGSDGVVSEPRVISRAIDFATRTVGDGRGDKNGIDAEFGNMITGAGWIAVGPGYRLRRDVPATQDVFPAETALARADQPDYLHAELSVTADTRDHLSFPKEGGMYGGSWTRFSDRDGGNFSFQRFEAEGAHFVSTRNRLATLAVRGWVVASDTAEGHDIPFYLMPSLGGNNTPRSFANYRFHDRHLAVANVELMFPILAVVPLLFAIDLPFCARVQSRSRIATTGVRTSRAAAEPFLALIKARIAEAARVGGTAVSSDRAR